MGKFVKPVAAWRLFFAPNRMDFNGIAEKVSSTRGFDIPKPVVYFAAGVN